MIAVYVSYSLGFRRGCWVALLARWAFSAILGGAIHTAAAYKVIQKRSGSIQSHNRFWWLNGNERFREQIYGCVVVQLGMKYMTFVPRYIPGPNPIRFADNKPPTIARRRHRRFRKTPDLDPFERPYRSCRNKTTRPQLSSTQDTRGGSQGSGFKPIMMVEPDAAAACRRRGAKMLRRARLLGQTLCESTARQILLPQQVSFTQTKPLPQSDEASHCEYPVQWPSSCSGGMHMPSPAALSVVEKQMQL